MPDKQYREYGDAESVRELKRSGVLVRVHFCTIILIPLIALA
jgi:hypothetical protein